MTLAFWALTFDFTGKIFIAIMALLVHRRIRSEKKIDIHVIKEMRLEQTIGVLAIVLIVISYIMNLYL